MLTWMPVASSMALYTEPPTWTLLQPAVDAENSGYKAGYTVAEDPPAPRRDDWESLPVMVINLDSRPDRLAKLATTLKNTSGAEVPFGLEQTCRLPAVMSKAAGDDLVAAGVIQDAVWQRAKVSSTMKKQDSEGIELSYGSVGCFLSHAVAWKRIVDLKLPAALILEDDTRILSPLMRRRFPSFSRDLPAGWNLVQFNGCFGHDESKEWWVGRAGEYGPDGFVATDRSDFAVDLNGCDTVRWLYGGAQKYRCPVCLGAYLLSLEGAKHMLKESFPMQAQVDSYRSPAFANVPGHYYTDPPLALQYRHDDSDVQLECLASHDKVDEISGACFKKYRAKTEDAPLESIPTCSGLPKSTSTFEYLSQTFAAYTQARDHHASIKTKQTPEDDDADYAEEERPPLPEMKERKQRL